MNFQRIGIGLGLVVAFNAFACKGDDEKKPRTREEFCRDWAQAACSEDTVSACQASDAESCRQSQEDYCRKLVPVDFSDEKGQACIDAVKKAYEDADLQGSELATVLSLGGACDKLIQGDTDEGDDCDSNHDCDAPGGFVCVRHADKPEGTCQIPETVDGGRDCSGARKICENGFYCNGDNCIEAKDASDDCTIQEECGETAFCSNAGKCEERHSVGAVCTSDIECDDGVCYEFDGKKTCTDRIRLGRAEPLCDELK
jgi:hypothetical protein